MSVTRTRRPGIISELREEAGFTLLEVLVAALIGVIVTGAAFSFLIFATEDASHITERVGIDQRARVALQRIVSEMHSSCVTPGVVPVLEGSNATSIAFVSEPGEEAVLSPIEKHVLTFTAPNGSKPGTLEENTYMSTGGGPPPSAYTWATTPATTTKILTGIRQTSYEKETATPVFRYYRYYRQGDAIPAERVAVPYGELNPTPIENVTKELSPYIVKVTIAFTATPEGSEAPTFNKDRPVPLEDSVVFRVASSSENASTSNLPCSENV